MGYVENSNHWLMEYISILHCCGDRLQESMGEVLTLSLQHLYPSLTEGVLYLAGQIEELRASVFTQVEELIEDVEAVDLDLKRYIPNLQHGVATLVS